MQIRISSAAPDAADLDHVIDCTRTAEHPALRHEDAASTQVCLGKRSVGPVAGAILQLSLQRGRLDQV